MKGASSLKLPEDVASQHAFNNF